MTQIHRLMPFLVGLLLLLPMRLLANPADLPAGFDYVDKHIPRLMTELKYFSSANFVGQPIDGYRANRAILTLPAIEALAEVQKELNAFGLGIKIYDAYRPQRSVDHFIRWSTDETATDTQPSYYPNVPKNELFAREYLARQSGHSRGSTVDLTLVDLGTGKELDMGSAFDLFDPVSWPTAAALTSEQRAHRLLLSAVMRQHGFKPYPKEWWHFTLTNEPFPEIYFDFPVE
jgi:D-alanyl-D-alanine dipeptidase